MGCTAPGPAEPQLSRAGAKPAISWVVLAAANGRRPDARPVSPRQPARSCTGQAVVSVVGPTKNPPRRAGSANSGWCEFDAPYPPCHLLTIFYSVTVSKYLFHVSSKGPFFRALANMTSGALLHQAVACVTGPPAVEQRSRRSGRIATRHPSGPCAARTCRPADTRPPPCPSACGPAPPRRPHAGMSSALQPRS